MKISDKVSGYTKAIITRILFILHGFFAIFLVVKNKDDSSQWWPVIFLFLLLIESAYTLFVRHGHEYKYFWPSCFLYIMSVLPSVWMMELDLYEERMADLNSNAQRVNNNTTLSETREQDVWQKLSKETIAQKVGALGLTIGIIVGRWLLPRGKITRDQLSALLIGYVGIAADILEVFSLFEEENLKHNKSITMITLVVFSWCLVSFCLVTTATTGNEGMKNKVLPAGDETPDLGSPALKNEYINIMKEKRRKDTEEAASTKRKEKARRIWDIREQIGTRTVKGTFSVIPKRQFDIHGDIYGILSGIFMMDGPFLVFRLYCTVHYSVYSEMHLFYLSKNAISLALLVYRLCILTCKDFDDNDDFYDQTDEDKLRNVQVAVVGTRYKNFKKSNNALIE